MSNTAGRFKRAFHVDFRGSPSPQLLANQIETELLQPILTESSAGIYSELETASLGVFHQRGVGRDAFYAQGHTT